MKLKRSITIATLLAAMTAGTFAARAGTFVPDPSQLWPNGKVYFVFNSDVPDGTGMSGVNNVATMCNAMTLWAAEANLSFEEICNGNPASCGSLPCTADTPSDWIRYQNVTGPASFSSGIGRTGGQQTISIRVPTGNQGPPGSFGLAHEMGHALGIYHEQQRFDRDTFITVDTDNVVNGLKSNYDIINSALAYPRAEHGVAVPFDFESLEMYALCRFSTCGDGCANNPGDCENNQGACRPITVNAPWGANWGGFLSCCGQPSGTACIGQRNHFSPMDSLVMSFLYPQPGWRFVDWVYSGKTETGVFQQPHREFVDGEAAAPNNGTLFVQPGTYSAVGVYNKPLRVKAPIGPVLLSD